MSRFGMRAGFFSLFFFLLPSFLFADDFTAEKKAAYYLRELCFEITRYNVTGLTSIPDVIALSEISKFGSSIMSHRKIVDSVQNPVYLCEYYFPEKTGIIDSTSSSRDLFVMPKSSDEGELPFEADWIDLVLQGLNSDTSPVAEIFDVNDGSKILDILEGGDSRGIDGLEESKNEENLPPEFTYSKRDGSLRRFSYDGEQFSVWNEGESTVIANFYGTKLVRKYFDSLYRLSKTEVFKTASTARKMSLETATRYEYGEGMAMPQKAIEEQIGAKKILEKHYDERGRIVYSLESHYETKKKEEILRNDKKILKMYDSEGRIQEEEIIIWNYKSNSSGKESVVESSSKNVYDYSLVSDEGIKSPNLFYYENGELHLVRKYVSPDSYSEKMYFDDGFSVEVIYENGIKKTEIIYMNDVEKRRRNFEY